MKKQRGIALQKLFLVLFTSLFLINLVIAAEYPKLNGWVNDFAHKLTPEQEQLLSDHISLIEKNTSVEIVIVTINSTNGEDRTLYAAHLSEQNGVGKKETDNGLIILWSNDNEKGGAIATGRGIESILNDAKVTRIGRKYRPLMDEGKFYEAFEGILNDTQKELVPGTDMTTPMSSNIADEDIVGIAIVLVVLGLLLWMIFKSAGFSRSDYDSSGSFAGGVATGAILSGSGRSSSSNSGGSSSSSFGGFGGGSFGGGGGKW